MSSKRKKMEEAVRKEIEKRVPGMGSRLIVDFSCLDAPKKKKKKSSRDGPGDLPEVGDRVSFVDDDGTEREGLVGNIKTRQRRGRLRKLAERVSGDPSSLDQVGAEIVVNDPEFEGYMVVGLSRLEILESAGNRMAREDRRAEAIRVLEQAKEKIKRSNRKVLEGRLEEASHLVDLPRGSRILVETNNFSVPTFHRAFFGGLTKSGRVRFVLSISQSNWLSPSSEKGRTFFAPPRKVSLESALGADGAVS